MLLISVIPNPVACRSILKLRKRVSPTETHGPLALLCFKSVHGIFPPLLCQVSRQPGPEHSTWGQAQFAFCSRS
ncbi:hypothetical protein BD779DRAFT_1196823 [Infundibulicybe gibba]|nr:hypothetical protein BD779DRAFT_1196823 [Infundibulicybe gibba]